MAWPRFRRKVSGNGDGDEDTAKAGRGKCRAGGGGTDGVAVRGENGRMDPIKQLADELDRDRAERCARMTPEEQRRMDEYLEDLSRRIALDGIRDEFPDADEAQIQAIFNEREAILAKLRKHQQAMNESKPVTDPP
jgi:hypothetical protein